MPIAPSRAEATLYCDSRYDTTASARFCDNVRFSSAEPTLSVCPSMRKRKSFRSFDDNALPRLSSEARAAGVRSAEPVGKLTVRLTDGPACAVVGVATPCATGRGADVETVLPGDASGAGAGVVPPSLMPLVAPVVRLPVGFSWLMIESAD